MAQRALKLKQVLRVERKNCRISCAVADTIVVHRGSARFFGICGCRQVEILVACPNTRRTALNGICQMAEVHRCNELPRFSKITEAKLCGFLKSFSSPPQKSLYASKAIM